MARASRRETNGDDKRRRILDAARKLVAAHGIEATSTKAIAAEAGVPSGLVFYYFETKDDLVEAIFNDSPHVIENALAKAQGSSRQIEAFLRAFYEGALAHRYQGQIIVAATASGHPMAEKASAWRRRSQAMLADYLRSRSTGKTAVAPEALANVVISSVLVAVLLDVPKDVTSFLKGLASVVKCGLGEQIT